MKRRLSPNRNLSPIKFKVMDVFLFFLIKCLNINTQHHYILQETYLELEVTRYALLLDP